jgi:hypothetical protein
MASSRAKGVTKKFLGYPDHGIDVISTKHWFGCFQQNPLPHVGLRCICVPAFQSLGVPTGQELPN